MCGLPLRISLTSFCTLFMTLRCLNSSVIAHSRTVEVVSVPATKMSYKNQKIKQIKMRERERERDPHQDESFDAISININIVFMDPKQNIKEILPAFVFNSLIAITLPCQYIHTLFNYLLQEFINLFCNVWMIIMILENKDSDYHDLILSFDMGNELFHEIRGIPYSKRGILAPYYDSLALICHCSSDSGVDILQTSDMIDPSKPWNEVPNIKAAQQPRESLQLQHKLLPISPSTVLSPKSSPAYHIIR
ncbi:uncharacterized protein LOC132282469 isoform X2 [Cornus florida]|uniref:uncharacterized protein LOC132282469 isoform X2 n=1 Tax=Cornus florida TaxID=4283 RepID=UPI0028A2CA0D|nr:uncharacterized protein LOC132282469 isoform X2 [Cornus florida]